MSALLLISISKLYPSRNSSLAPDFPVETLTFEKLLPLRMSRIEN